MFGQKTRPVEDFLPRILAHVDGVDVDMAKAFVVDSAIQFCRDTGVLRELLCLKLDPCRQSYKLHTRYRIIQIHSVRFFSNGMRVHQHATAYYVQDDTFYTTHTSPYANLTAEVELVVAPARDSDSLPDFLYEDWADAVSALTLSKLYLLTDNAWYDPQAANNQISLYNQLVRQARFTKITKHRPFQMRLVNRRQQ